MTECQNVECITERRQVGNLRDALARLNERLRIAQSRNHRLMRIIRRQDKLLQEHERND